MNELKKERNKARAGERARERGSQELIVDEELLVCI